ncbi:hypothetical protein AK812_SmicGene32170 [Symbiodinium microadriaticum]|uniref:Uncharacterized protein n=1 Tax=Symbiodinium microadriaticum TaxID=2951 RepID=A0A1Q9CUV8_SYMMI|nr:hypothetical protein AK812_SmicGene32170 [Symbiodinium microadriaticum]
MIFVEETFAKLLCAPRPGMRRLGLKGPFPIKSCGHDIGQSDVVGILKAVDSREIVAVELTAFTLADGVLLGHSPRNRSAKRLRSCEWQLMRHYVVKGLVARTTASNMPFVLRHEAGAVRLLGISLEACDGKTAQWCGGEVWTKQEKPVPAARKGGHWPVEDGVDDVLDDELPALQAVGPDSKKDD